MKKFFLIYFLFSFQLYAQQKAIIIGASTGIGKAVAEEFLAHDFVVGITARRVNLLEQIQSAYEPGRVYVEYMDVQHHEDAQRAFAALVEAMGGVDIVIINAGTFPGEPRDFDENNELAWAGEERIIDVNVKGFVALANEALAYFNRRGSGHLVGISSVDALRGAAVCPVYCATKGFISRYLEGYRNKYIQQQIPIDITEIRPGYVQTSFDLGPLAYWVSTPEEVARQIYVSIQRKDKVAYVTRRWALIALLLQIVPDWVYNKIGGF